MASKLTAQQESYIQSLKQLTTGTSSQNRYVLTGDGARPGLGSKARQQAGKEYTFFDSTQQLRQALDISNKALLASFIFWLLLLALLYTFGSYLIMLLRVTSDDADLEGTCLSKFSTSSEKNLEIVQNYPAGDAAPYIARFASHNTGFEDYPLDSEQLPPIVTAASSQQFYLLQGFIKHVEEDLRRMHKDIVLFVYDLGLYAREREILTRYCGCHVRSVDYSVYPSHVSYLDNFAWRPLVIQELLDEFGAVIYVDVTTRFKSHTSLKYFRARGQNHIIIWDTPTITSLVAYTSKHMFSYFNESRCLYRDAALIDSQVLAFYRTSVTWNQVMRPWLMCALTPDCISPSWSRYAGCLHFRHPSTTGCHRYDLSALGIIVNRGQQMTLTTNSRRYIAPRLTYVSHDEPAWFLEQPWSSNQILMLAALPFVVITVIIRKHIYKFLARNMLSKQKYQY